MPRLLAVALSVPTVVLTVATILGAIHHPNALAEANAATAIDTSIGVAFLAVGLLILARMPRHAIGWVLIALALDVSVMVFTDRLRVSDPVIAGSAEAIAGVTWAVALPLVVILMLLFPTGRAISPRWHWAVWAAALWAPVLLAVNLASPVWMRGGRVEPNAGGLGGPLGQFLAALLPVLVGAIVPLLCIGGVAVVVRFTRARGDERLQLKWVASAAAALAVCTLLSFTPIWVGWLTPLDELSILALPIAIAIAILRHRLYDIDVIIRRTLVYGSLTVLLGAVYAMSVVVLTQFLGAFARDNQLAVVASTVAVAVLFQPLRRRVQDGVDRRFYRSRVHAGQVVDALGAQLRNEVDLDSLTADLCVAVTETMQPRSTSVWLRGRPLSAS